MTDLTNTWVPGAAGQDMVEQLRRFNVWLSQDQIETKCWFVVQAKILRHWIMLTQDTVERGRFPPNASAWKLLGRLSSVSTPTFVFEAALVEAGVIHVIRDSILDARNSTHFEHVGTVMYNIACSPNGAEPLLVNDMLDLLTQTMLSRNVIYHQLDADGMATVYSLLNCRGVARDLKWNSVKNVPRLVEGLLTASLRQKAKNECNGIYALNLIHVLATEHKELHVLVQWLEGCDGAKKLGVLRDRHPSTVDLLISACVEMRLQAESAVAASSNGFPNELFDPPLPDCFECGICSFIVRDPPNLGNCSHLFCGTCIAAWSMKQRECPGCREPFASLPLVPNAFASLQISQAPVKCPHRDETGCTWSSPSMGTNGRLLLQHETETCAVYMSKKHQAQPVA